jgi:antitoxin MazE
MKTTISSFGDSLGVKFPKSLLKRVPIFENDDVEILIRNNNIIIKRQESKKHLTTKERIAAFCQTVEDIQSEIDWGKPQGKEIW